MSVTERICTISLSSAFRRGLLSLLLLIPALPSCKASKDTATVVTADMVVIEIRDGAIMEGFRSVIFKGSQRIYQLPNDAKPEYMKLLEASKKQGTLVRITRKDEQSDMIISVAKVRKKKTGTSK